MVVTQQPEREESVRRTDSRLSIGCDGFVGRYSSLLEHLAQHRRRLKLLGGAVHRVVPFQVHRAGDTSSPLGAHSVGASPLAVRPHIEEHTICSANGFPDIVGACDPLFLDTWGKGTLWRLGWHDYHRGSNPP